MSSAPWIKIFCFANNFSQFFGNLKNLNIASFFLRDDERQKWVDWLGHDEMGYFTLWENRGMRCACRVILCQYRQRRSTDCEIFQLWKYWQQAYLSHFMAFLHKKR